jgi:predicted phosphoribosyltransferase
VLSDAGIVSFHAFWRSAAPGTPRDQDRTMAMKLLSDKRLSRRSLAMFQLPFADRQEAGGFLADRLSQQKFPDDAVVLALPRGGVPVGFAIAQRLHLPLDVLVARKLGVPWQPELAMGAIAGTARVLNEQLIQQLGISNEHIDFIISREQEESKRREELYRGGRPPLDLRKRSVILVDDGLATGSTMLAAARYVRSLEPARVNVAVPVGSRQACAHLRTEADEVICLAMPTPFFGVGQWYRDFRQVSDAEVQNLLRKSTTLAPEAAVARFAYATRPDASHP